MNNEVKGEIARELQERNRHIDIATARYYVDAVCDLLSRYGQAAQASGQALDVRTLYYELVGIDEDIRHDGLTAFDQTCLNTLRRVMRALADAAFSPNQAASAEPVYAYRRKGMDNFTTCTRERFEELQDKPHLFETRIFCAAPVAAQAPQNDDETEGMRAHIALLRASLAQAEQELDDLRVATQAPAVPEGWKLVPVEPTLEMLDSADDAIRDFPRPVSRYETPLAPKIAYYKAMLAAAPTPPASAAPSRSSSSSCANSTGVNREPQRRKHARGKLELVSGDAGRGRAPVHRDDRRSLRGRHADHQHAGLAPPRSSEGSEVLDLPFHRRVVFEGRRHPLPDLHREDAMSNIELKVARTYRAKKPRESRGFVNDRTVIYIGTNFVQYDGPAVGVGRRYSKVSTSDFLKWADRDVTDELPDGEYAPWPPAKLEAAPDAKPAAHPLRPAAPHLSDIEHPEQHARADSPESDGETFAAWLAREIPPGTVISNPAWWAPRILRAALRATPQPAAQAAPDVSEDTPEAVEGTIQVLKECGGFTEQAPVIRQLRRYATLLAALTTQGESRGV